MSAKEYFQKHPVVKDDHSLISEREVIDFAEAYAQQENAELKERKIELNRKIISIIHDRKAVERENERLKGLLEDAFDLWQSLEKAGEIHLGYKGYDTFKAKYQEIENELNNG